MNMLHRLRLIGLALLCAPLAWALNNAEVIQMHQAGMADETIVLAIGAGEPDFDLGVDALIALKQAGISDAVIQAMIGNSAPAAGETPSGLFAMDFPSIAPPFVEPAVGGTYYLRCNLHFEDNTSLATNYARGEVLRINTEVSLTSVKRKKIKLVRVADGRKFEIVNVPGYTLKTTEELARLLFSAEQTPLEGLPEEVAKAIREGVMRKGMTKEQVLMARGYPPAHRTPSTDDIRWTYWNNRFAQQTIVFDSNGRLAEGRDLF